MLQLLKIVGVTSTDMIFSIDFAFLKSEKENNVTWTLKVRRTILKDQENMSQVILTDRDITLMNSVANVFSTPYTLLCRYHITKICEK